MDIDIPDPNPWRGDFLLGPQCRAIVTERGNTAVMLYQAEVAKRSSELAASAHCHVDRGGRRRNYWAATVSVGSGHILPHEFGADTRYDENRGDPSFDETEGAHDLSNVLEMLIWVPL